MLRKLVKYEFRATGRVFLPMYLILLVMSFVARVVYAGTVGRNPLGLNMSGTLVVVVVSLVMVMLFTAVWVVTLALILRRFWRNLLGREGYLMNVLPVDPWEHVSAKLLTAMVWMLLSFLASAAAMLIIFSGVADLAWEKILRGLAEQWAFLREQGAAGRAALLLAEGVLLALARIARFILTVYASMCVGQLVNRRRVWLSLGSWIGISTALSILESVYVSLRFRTETESYTFTDSVMELTRSVIGNANAETGVLLLLSLLLCAGLFFATQLLLKKKLNLQ